MRGDCVVNNGYTWIGTVGEEGIGLTGYDNIYGNITSTTDFVNINMYGKGYGVAIYGLIHDSGSRKVGVRVKVDSGYNTPELWLHAKATNDFSGDLVVERNAKVVLCNLAGFASVSTKKIRVIGGGLYTYIGNQISRDASIELSSGGSFNLGVEAGSVERIHSLNVYGSGYLDFLPDTIGHPEHRGARTLFLDDLWVSSAGELVVKNWEDGMHRLLVKKNSWNLKDALSRINFEGFGGGADLRWSAEYDYWEVYGKLPEPATYGAIFAVAGLGLALCRRSRRGALKKGTALP